MSNLTDIIRSEISKHGPVTFERYMQLALYHPTLGYYRSGRDPFGREGDFFTAAQLQPVFAETIRAFIDRCTLASSCPEQWKVVDLGAGRGELRSVLSTTYNYEAVEVGDGPLGELPAGVVIANEFFDALPVRRAHRSASGEWRESFVGWSNNRFEFTESDLDVPPELGSYIELFGATIPPGGSIEINLEMNRWLERLAQVLHSGKILVIDYGYEGSELVRFGQGTLMSYHRHLSLSDVLRTPGTRDITSHVNFSWLKHLAVLHGFQVTLNRSLSQFVAQLWNSTAFRKRLEQSDLHFKAQWKQLAFGMGETFRIVVLSK